MAKGSRFCYDSKLRAPNQRELTQYTQRFHLGRTMIIPDTRNLNTGTPWGEQEGMHDGGERTRAKPPRGSGETRILEPQVVGVDKYSPSGMRPSGSSWTGSSRRQQGSQRGWGGRASSSSSDAPARLSPSAPSPFVDPDLPRPYDEASPRA